MLDKIISSKMLNPDYTGELKEFARVASKEKLVRSLGLVLIITALLLQVVAVILPSKTSAAASPNDLIPGGVTSKQQLVHDCQVNTNSIDRIFNFYGIDCSDLSSGTVISLNSLDYNKRLYSVGHLAYGLPGETPVNISGKTVYWRPLHAWDTNGSSTYTALKFTNSQNKTFFSLFTCGNLVSIGLPSEVIPPTPKPAPTPTPAPKPTPTPVPKPTPTPSPTPLPTPLPTPTPTPSPTSPPTPVCQYNSQILATDIDCKPCSSSTTQVDSLACLMYHKTAANLTQAVADANNTTARAGDVIQYKLSVTNNGKLTAKNFVIQDNIVDILDYSATTDLGGGSLDANGILSFPETNVEPGAVVTRIFSVTVKNPVPTTAPSADDPLKFNSVMTNVFGDTINVKVQQGTTQVILVTATNLPNTGPGTSMFIYALIASVAGYFYSVRRLQLKEVRFALELARLDGGVV